MEPAKPCVPTPQNPFCLPIPADDTPCTPFSSVDHALSVHADLSVKIPLLTAAFTRCSEVSPVWREYFAATSKPFSFGPGGCVVTAALSDPDGSARVQAQVRLILASVRANLPTLRTQLKPEGPFELPGRPVAEVTMPVEKAVQKERFLHADVVYNDPFNAAANLAGGTGTNGQGSDVFGDDDRIFSGPVKIRATHVDFVTGRMDGTIFYDPHLRVKDTVDFCPGNLGNSSQREFTLPMSKLEAQGLTRDVPITIDYDPPGGFVDFAGA